MTIDECIEYYCSCTRCVLSKEDIRNILNLLLAGETLTSTARKLNIKVCNVATVRNVFEDRCGLVFPNAKRQKRKQYNSKIKEVILATNDDIAKLIKMNAEIEGESIKEYIRKSLKISEKKVNELFREGMEIYCKGSVI